PTGVVQRPKHRHATGLRLAPVGAGASLGIYGRVHPYHAYLAGSHFVAGKTSAPIAMGARALPALAYGSGIPLFDSVPRSPTDWRIPTRDRSLSNPQLPLVHPDGNHRFACDSGEPYTSL